MYRIGIISLILVCCLACEKEGYDAPELQPVFFEYHYINHAWGYQDHGWLIDREGTIRRFELPMDYNLGTHGDYLSLEQLEHNLGQADSVCGEIGKTVFDQKTDLIPAASEGEIEDIQWRGADMGMGIFSCYRYDPAEDAYQYVLLSASGDYLQNNLSTEAEDLAKWLKGLVEGYFYY
ncbi:MAG: hypothetical protein ABFS28_05345 [Bacteroidota bacterium]